MEHHIARQCVCPCLRAALGVDGAGDVTQVAKDVECVKHTRYLAFHEWTRKAGVPHNVVSVHHAPFIATAAIHGEVSAKLQFPRKLKNGVYTIFVVKGTDAGEINALAVDVAPSQFSHNSTLALAETAFQLYLLAKRRGVDFAPLRLNNVACRAASHVNIVDVCYSCLRLQIKQSALVYWTLVVVAHTNIIIAVDVAWLVCPYASLGVVCLAHSQGIRRRLIVDGYILYGFLLKIVQSQSLFNKIICTAF